MGHFFRRLNDKDERHASHEADVTVQYCTNLLLSTVLRLQTPATAISCRRERVVVVADHEIPTFRRMTHAKLRDCKLEFWFS